MATTSITRAADAVEWLSIPGTTLRQALDYLPGAAFTVDRRAVDRAIGSLTYGQSRSFVARDAYGEQDVRVTVGYTGNGNIGGKFFWKVEVVAV